MIKARRHFEAPSIVHYGWAIIALCWWKSRRQNARKRRNAKERDFKTREEKQANEHAAAREREQQQHRAAAAFSATKAHCTPQHLSATPRIPDRLQSVHPK